MSSEVQPNILGARYTHCFIRITGDLEGARSFFYIEDVDGLGLRKTEEQQEAKVFRNDFVDTLWLPLIKKHLMASYDRTKGNHIWSIHVVPLVVVETDTRHFHLEVNADESAEYVTPETEIDPNKLVVAETFSNEHLNELTVEGELKPLDPELLYSNSSFIEKSIRSVAQVPPPDAFETYEEHSAYDVIQALRRVGELSKVQSITGSHQHTFHMETNDEGSFVIHKVSIPGIVSPTEWGDLIEKAKASGWYNLSAEQYGKGSATYQVLNLWRKLDI
ncbi:hypothetical protein AVT69_gp237 [Pseudomonas phage PhiPA3]|uniref:Uncharacterized protein 239 n=1 Tax=Pseudomonas phage PhiPA3 TaxID=998086 RepID=F8SJ82_BPPA3|nr:hypothetical protein AVT69_gp237 [Pseudomonas phage PhiPA3]AEH03662.1 hypothetical protein [Pseudomonas phage PhiPA3]